MTLGSFWGALWVVLGLKWCQILSWVCLVLATRYFSLNTSKTNRISWFLPSPWACKTFQNRSKRLPKASFFHLRFRLRFWYDFGTILAPKMPPFGRPFGAKVVTWNLLGTSWGLLGASWGLPGTSLGCHGGSKRLFLSISEQGGCS